MRGVAAGARRLKNRYGSTLEVLSHVQLWYLERETRDLVRIQQCELLESFHKAQSDYALSTGLAVVSEVAEQVLPERETAEAMFRLLLLTVREIERTGDWKLPLAYFAFWTVRLGGYLPPLDRCAKCGRAVGEDPAFRAPWEAGLLCENCRRGGMKPLHVEGRKLAGQFTSQKLDQLQMRARVDSAVAELREAALDWIEQHTEKRLGTRDLLETP